MKKHIIDLINHCCNNMCECCTFHNDTDNKCSAEIHGKAPFYYFRLMGEVLDNAIVVQDILSNKEVEIDENNSKRTY